MRQVYLERFNDLEFMNVCLNNSKDYKIANYACKLYESIIWRLVLDIQSRIGIKSTEYHDVFWDHSMTRLQFYEEMGFIEKRKD